MSVHPCSIPAGTSLAAIAALPDLPRLELRMALCHVLKLSRVQLITQNERCLNAAEAAQLSELLSRRLAGEPMAYLVGQREFYGLSFAVNPAVLIPRPETELLVDLALERLTPDARVLDLGTGSGAIAVALAHTRRDAQVTATDASTAALICAQGNAANHGLALRFFESDWYAALSDQRFEMIVSNPPYIEAGDAHLSEGDLRFEPLSALTDHGDGLSALRAIIAGAAAHLAPEGWLLLEHGYDQAEAVRGLLLGANFQGIFSTRDLAGIARVTGGRL